MQPSHVLIDFFFPLTKSDYPFTSNCSARSHIFAKLEMFDGRLRLKVVSIRESLTINNSIKHINSVDSKEERTKCTFLDGTTSNGLKFESTMGTVIKKIMNHLSCGSLMP